MPEIGDGPCVLGGKGAVDTMKGRADARDMEAFEKVLTIDRRV
jgi:hypothetical protein